MLFQKKIFEKYLKGLNQTSVNEAWSKYKAYFLNKEIQANIHASKEEQFQEGFLRELFVKILGYTINPSPGYNLITEFKNEGNAKKTDGAIILDGNAIGVIELKDHKTHDLSNIEAQAFGYKNKHKNTRIVIISNFEKLRLYIDNAVEYCEWDIFHMKESDFRELYLCMSWQQVKHGILLQMKDESVSTEEQITNALYGDYSQFKSELFADILVNNPVPDGKEKKEWQLLLFKKTQKLLDRFLFIFFAEDCGLLPFNTMLRIIEEWKKLTELDEYRPLYSRIEKYFGYLDKGHQDKKEEIFAYNGGLFKPDEILDNLSISDEVLEKYTTKLASYDFESDVDVNILGHIFEHSLSEIEEVTRQINDGGLTSFEKGRSRSVTATSKRKRDGIFYTPQYITKYIVENTVGRLCREKKRELGIVEDEYFSDKRRQQKTKNLFSERLQQYRDWLLQITILDPACGSGAFLNAALQFLIAELRHINEMKSKLFGDDIIFNDIENDILENNLFGVDINEESVGIAQLSLWLRTAKPYRKLNTLSGNIKCGNSLISDPAIAGDKAFDWRQQFPQVFEKGGFDVVIGNPPYVSAIEIKKSYSPKAFNYIKNNYKTAKGAVDLYIYFFEKGLSLLKDKGVLAFITPNRYLSASYGAALRKIILNKYSFYQLIDYSDKKVFHDASTYPVITMLQNSRYSANVLCGKFDEQTHELIGRQIPSNQLNILEESILGFLLNDKLSITQKVIFQSVPLSASGEINATSTAKEADEYASLISETPCGHKLINTGTIDPYTTLWGMVALTKQGKRYLRPYLPGNDSRISSNRHKLYSSPKIIVSKIGLKCEAFFDVKGEYASIDTNCIHDFNDDYLPEYVLCWLNSKLYNYTFECFFDGLRMSGGYLLYSSPNLKNTYIKPLIIEEQQPFVDLACTMFTLTSQLRENRCRFLRRLNDNLGTVKATTALQAFDKMSFKEFMAELKKQKIRLTLSQQDEWETYFNERKMECQKLTAKLNSTDNEINKIVYHLYGLTYDEVLTVDPKTPITRSEYENR